MKDIDIKLELILLEYGNKLLDVANGRGNPTIGEMIDEPKEKIKQLIKEM